MYVVLYIGWIGVSWQRHCKTCRLLRERQPGYIPFRFFFFFAVAATVGRVTSFVRGGEPQLRTRGMIGSRNGYGKAPTRQLHSTH